MRRLLTVAVVAAVAGVVAVAVVDVLRGSSSSLGEDPSEAREASVSQPQTSPPPLPSWEGRHRWTVRLSRAVGATWEEVRTLDPGNYGLTVRIDLPRGADVYVALQSGISSSSRFTLGLLGPRVPRDCRRKNEREICVSDVELPQSLPDVWRLVVRKPSEGRAVVRLQVAFTRVSSTQG